MSAPLLTAIDIERPPVIRFGPGLAAQVGAFARARRCVRPLVVADAFNASLSAHGVPESDLGAMAAEAFAIRRLLDNNPRDITRDEIAAMYQRAL